MDVHRTISTTNITLFNIHINLLKSNWISKLGDIVSLLKKVDNVTARVLISAKIGVCVQGSTSEIWNYPIIDNLINISIELINLNYARQATEISPYE